MLKIHSRSAQIIPLAVLNFVLFASPILAATYNVSTPSQLISAIHFANLTPQADTINLRYGTYTLTSVNHFATEPYEGASGLPMIASPITINGNGATIRRLPTAPDFRIMRVGAGGDLTLNDLTITGGSYYSGAGIYGGFYAVKLTMNNCVVSQNNTTEFGQFLAAIGGGIYAVCPLRLFQCRIEDNTAVCSSGAAVGGGIVALNDVEIIETTILRNGAFGSWSQMGGGSGGGGVYLFPGFFGSENAGLVEGCTFQENRVDEFVPMDGIHIDPIAAKDHGPQLHSQLQDAGHSKLFGFTFASGEWLSTLISSPVLSRGGGLAAALGQGIVRNSTFVGNLCRGHDSTDGSGFWGAAQILHCTFSDNSCSDGAYSDGGSLATIDSAGTVLIGSTIVSENLPANFGGGSFTSIGHNLSSDDSALSIFIHPTDMNSTPAMLGAFGDFGGFTKTIPLLPGSPAIDAGDSASTLNRDQRGWPRPMDGDGNGVSIVDIGAFELYRRANDVESWMFYE